MNSSDGNGGHHHHRHPHPTRKTKDGNKKSSTKSNGNQQNRMKNHPKKMISTIPKNNKDNADTNRRRGRGRRKILVLHGNRQTGELLVGRMKSLKRKLLKPRIYDNDDDMASSRFKSHDIDLVAIDAPFVWQSDAAVHNDHNNGNDERLQHQRLEKGQEQDEYLLRTWWHRDGNEYTGLEDSFSAIHDLWMATNSNHTNDGNNDVDDNNNDNNFEGILGFSQGARLTHLIALLHKASHGKLFSGLKYVIISSGE